MTTRTEPLILRFAEALPEVVSPPWRFSPSLQMAEIHVDGAWTPAIDHRGFSDGTTRKTGVGRETTDDD